MTPLIASGQIAQELNAINEERIIKEGKKASFENTLYTLYGAEDAIIQEALKSVEDAGDYSEEDSS